jgi:hypothetical protein
LTKGGGAGRSQGNCTKEGVDFLDRRWFGVI